MRKKLLPLAAGPRGAGMQNTTEINHVLPTCVPGGHGFYTLPDLTVAIQYVTPRPGQMNRSPVSSHCVDRGLFHLTDGYKIYK